MGFLNGFPPLCISLMNIRDWKLVPFRKLLTLMVECMQINFWTNCIDVQRNMAPRIRITVFENQSESLLFIHFQALWSVMTSTTVFMTYDSGVVVWWFISSSFFWLARQDTVWASFHSNLQKHLYTILQLWTPIFIDLSIVYTENSIDKYNFCPPCIRRWLFFSAAVQSFVHLLLWRLPEGFFSGLPFLGSYVTLVWSWQQRSALLVG